MLRQICAPRPALMFVASGALSGLGIAIFRHSASAFLVGLMTAYALIVFNVLLTRLRPLPRPNGLVPCHHRLALDDAGVGIDTPFWTGRHRWAGVMAVEDGKAHYFFRIDTAAAYAVPKRAFADTEALEGFIRFARERVSGSRSAS